MRIRCKDFDYISVQLQSNIK